MDITRRDLLKTGAVAAGAVVATPAAALAHGAENEEIPEPEVSATRLRQWVMVVDQDACDGCAGLSVPPQCTQACNWSRFVPEGQQWIEVFPAESGQSPELGSSFLPAPCMQCQNAPCVNVCPVGATFHTPEGVVLVDQSRCIGCRLCMAACPYDRRFFNWGEPDQPEMARNALYDVRTQIPAMRGTVMKCDFCSDKLAEGGLPACVETCPRHAIYVGDLEEGIATNGASMVELSELLGRDGVGRFKEDLGTEPRVYYVPGHGDGATLDDLGVERGFSEGHPASRLMKDRLEWLTGSLDAEARALAAREGVSDG
jgi:molybdopterin-containing oxidoreductase family iron-sulfur binding subunit